MTVPEANIFPRDSDIRIDSIVTVWMIFGLGEGPGNDSGIEIVGRVDKSQWGGERFGRANVGRFDNPRTRIGLSFPFR